jgi:hypothetical protein
VKASGIGRPPPIACLLYPLAIPGALAIAGVGVVAGAADRQRLAIDDLDQPGGEDRAERFG